MTEDLLQKKQIKQEGLNELIKKRWSPNGFSDKEIDSTTLNLLFEAARWSPSSYNAQPWNFIIGNKTTSPEVYNRLHSLLVEYNQGWTITAPVLILSFTNLKFQNGNDNHCAEYDLGQSVAYLTFQATDLGLYVHQMSGFDSKKAKDEFKIGENFKVVSVIAVGYLGDVEKLNEPYKSIQQKERERKEVKGFVFSGDVSFS